MQLNEKFLFHALPSATLLYKHFLDSYTASIDSRVVKSGDIFVALLGKTLDGHSFVKEALHKGAGGAIIARDKKHCLDGIEKSILEKKLIILVDDTLKALLSLAGCWRAQFSIPIVAITGSVGKTSTKERLATILEYNGASYCASYGTQNTLIGVSLNLLRLRKEHEVGIFELGINRRGEMNQLANLVRPTMAIITGLGHSHMKYLGSIINIAAEKREIFRYFEASNIGIVNGDQPLLAQVAYTHPVVKFGSKTTNQIQARKISFGVDSLSFILKIYKERYPVVVPGNHQGVVTNALAASTAAYLLHIPSRIIKDAIQLPLVISGRFEFKELNNKNGILINDCYNASPESTKEALLAFERFDTADQKIFVLGDMHELGVNSAFWHRQVGRFLRKAPSIKKIILVGSFVAETKRTLPVNFEVEHVDSWESAVPLLKKLVTKKSAVLIKGSRAVGLDHLVQEFVE